MNSLEGKIEIAQGHIYWSVEGDNNEVEYVIIHDLFVGVYYRRKGFAKLLMNTAISIIKKQYPDMEIRIIPESSDKDIDLIRLVKFYNEFNLIVWIRSNLLYENQN